MLTKERPILFTGGMVKAILEGRKTQTRRSASILFGSPWVWVIEFKVVNGKPSKRSKILQVGGSQHEPI